MPFTLFNPVVFSRPAIAVFLLLALPMVCLGDGQEDSLQDIRLPSKIWDNVKVMKETVFDSLPGNVIDLESDVRNYIDYELKRIESSQYKAQGQEAYFLGLLYMEIGDYEKAILHLEEFLREPDCDTDTLEFLQGKSNLVLARIKNNDLERASKELARLERSLAPFLELLMLEMAKAHARAGHHKTSLDYARKAIPIMDPALAVSLVDNTVAHFLKAGMKGNARALIDDLIGTVQSSELYATQKFLEIRKKQIQMIGTPMGALEGENIEWLGPYPSPTTRHFLKKGSSEAGKGPQVVILYFWAAGYPPCRNVFLFLEEMEQRYGSKGLAILGATRLHYLKDENDQNMPEDQEIKLLKELYNDAEFNITTMLDRNSSLHITLHVHDVPHLIVLDRKGVLRFFNSSTGLENDLVEGMVKDLLQEEHTEPIGEEQKKRGED